jgi:hypothetical protein
MPKIVEETFYTLDGTPIKWYYVEHAGKEIMFDTQKDAESFVAEKRMCVSASKCLTKNEIDALTDSELLFIFKQRVEEWLIEPMRILAKNPHSGFAIVALFKEVVKTLKVTLYVDAVRFAGYNVLNNPWLYISGDYPVAIETTENSVVINPNLIIGYAKELLANFNPPNLDSFRLFLIAKV